MRVSKELVVGAFALALTAAVCASLSSCATPDDGTPPAGEGEGALTRSISDDRVMEVVAPQLHD